MDVNKVWLSGIVVTTPILTKLSSKTPFATFTLQINEFFKDRSGKEVCRPNLVRIESLGRAAEVTASKIKRGRRYHVDGYLRQDLKDERDDVRVRSFAIYPEDTRETAHYRDGLKQALVILERSMDVKAAVKSIESILTEADSK